MYTLKCIYMYKSMLIDESNLMKYIQYNQWGLYNALHFSSIIHKQFFTIKKPSKRIQYLYFHAAIGKNEHTLLGYKI